MTGSITSMDWAALTWPALLALVAIGVKGASPAAGRRIASTTADDRDLMRVEWEFARLAWVKLKDANDRKARGWRDG